MEQLNIFVRPMPGRNTEEAHRAATPLELFYDLVSVIAIAAAASGLHHAIAENHMVEGLIKFTLAFFAIWWAWMNFTWFASAYDNDDVPYRIAVLIMMVGALVFAAGIPSFFSDANSVFGLIGYVIMRFSLVSLWLRAAAHDPDRKSTAQRYAAGVSLCQLGWVLGFIFVPQEQFLVFYSFMIICELLVPAYAEGATGTTWHKHHIVERYGLLMIIVLGESLLALYLAISATKDIKLLDQALLTWIGAGLIIVFTMWWLYFSEVNHHALNAKGTGFVWGYGHFVVYAAATAVGAGLAVGVDVITNHAAVDMMVATAAVTIPASIYVVGLWVVHERHNANTFLQNGLLPATGILVAFCTFVPKGVFMAALLLVICLVLKLRTQAKRTSVNA